MSTTEIIKELEGLFKAQAKPTEAHFKKLINAYLVNNDNKVGIGTNEPKNNLDVKGNVVIGDGFAGEEVAPGNGLIVKGNVGIGHEFADEALHIKGNIRLEEGGLIIGGTPIITAEGLWQGKFPDQEDDEPGSTHWTDGNDQVSTTVKVGIGETSPSADLHVKGNVQIDGGSLNVDGLVNKKQVAFIAHGHKKEASDNNQIFFENTPDQSLPNTPHLFNDSVFQPNAVHAGMYFLTANLTLPDGNKGTEGENELLEISPGEPTLSGTKDNMTNAQISFSIDGGLSPLLVVKPPGSCLHATASLVHYFDGNTALILYSSMPGVEFDQIILTGYRL